MGADYSFEVKNIEIWVPAFFMHNNSFVATVMSNVMDIKMRAAPFERLKETCFLLTNQVEAMFFLPIKNEGIICTTQSSDSKVCSLTNDFFLANTN